MQQRMIVRHRTNKSQKNLLTPKSNPWCWRHTFLDGLIQCSQKWQGVIFQVSLLNQVRTRAVPYTHPNQRGAVCQVAAESPGPSVSHMRIFTGPLALSFSLSLCMSIDFAPFLVRPDQKAAVITVRLPINLGIEISELQSLSYHLLCSGLQQT